MYCQKYLWNLLRVILWHSLFKGTLFQSEGDGDAGVTPYDYTPYFYFIMAVIVAAHLQFTLFSKPNLKRSQADQDLK